MCFSFPRQFDYDFFSKPPSEIEISLTSGFFLRLVRPKRASTLARGGCRRGRQDRRQPSEGASDVGARFGGFWLSMPDFLPLTLLGNAKGPFGSVSFRFADSGARSLGDSSGCLEEFNTQATAIRRGSISLGIQ